MTVQFYYDDENPASLAVWIHIVPNDILRRPLLFCRMNWMRSNDDPYRPLGPVLTFNYMLDVLPTPCTSFSRVPWASIDTTNNIPRTRTRRLIRYCFAAFPSAFPWTPWDFTSPAPIIPTSAMQSLPNDPTNNPAPVFALTFNQSKMISGALLPHPDYRAAAPFEFTALASSGAPSPGLYPSVPLHLGHQRSQL